MRDRSAERSSRLAELVVGFGANVQPGQIVGVTSYVGKEGAARRRARRLRARRAVGRRLLLRHLGEAGAPRARRGGPLDFVPPWIGSTAALARGRARRPDQLSRPADPAALDGIDPARSGRDMLPYLRRSARSSTGARRTGRRRRAPTARLGASRSTRTCRSEEAVDRLWDGGATSAGSTRTTPSPPGRSGRRRSTASPSGSPSGASTPIHLARPRHRPHGRPAADLPLAGTPSSRRSTACVHFPNIPTEEIFTTPDPRARRGPRHGDDAARALRRASSDGIRVEFEGGRAVEIDAEQRRRRAASARGQGRRRVAARRARARRRDGRIGPLGTVFSRR